MKLERRYFQDVTTTETDSKTTLSGYAVVFNSPSHDFGNFREVIMPDAIDLAENVFAFWSHDNSQPLASTRSGSLTLQIDETGLKFDLSTERFSPAQKLAADAGDLQMSFGFLPVEQSFTRDADGNTILEVRKLKLLEISPVVFPAYPETTAEMRSMFHQFESETNAEEIETEQSNSQTLIEQYRKLVEARLRTAK